eukprot:scaffold48_cov311-Pinguiococcus_pyrenoidosus.AAC.19
MVALSPGAAMILLLAWRQPHVVVLHFLGAVGWLVSLLLLAIVWVSVPPLKEAWGWVTVMGSVVQELCRLGVVCLYFSLGASGGFSWFWLFEIVGGVSTLLARIHGARRSQKFTHAYHDFMCVCLVFGRASRGEEVLADEPETAAQRLPGRVGLRLRLRFDAHVDAVWHHHRRHRNEVHPLHGCVQVRSRA